jgi:hypothetical protein
MLAITVRTETGENHARITSERLAELAAGLGAMGNRFLVVHRIAGDEEFYVQVWHEHGGAYELEHRAGSSERHFVVRLPAPDEVAERVAGWARKRDDWDAGLEWERVDLGPAAEGASDSSGGTSGTDSSDSDTPGKHSPDSDTPDSPADGLSAELLADFEEFVRTLVVGGYEGFDEIVEAADDWLEDEADGEAPGDLAGQVAGRLWRERLAEQAGWTGTTDPERLTRAFAALEARGITARENFTCCCTCGNAEMGEEAAEDAHGFVYFHTQCTDAAAGGHGLTLYFGGFGGSDEPDGTTVGVGHEVVAALTEAGLRTEWDGSAHRAITVTPLAWRKRLPQ